MVKITVAFAFVTAYLMLYSNDSTMIHIFFEGFSIKENCLVLVEGLHTQPGLEQEVQLIYLRACGLSVINQWAMEETCSKEANSSKLLFERFSMAECGIRLELWVSHSILWRVGLLSVKQPFRADWIGAQIHCVCPSSNLQNLPGGCLKPLY